MPLVLGRVLAKKYRLDAEIGAGAMGRVYRAHQLDLTRNVAIKVLHPLMAADEGAQLRFAREAKVAARLVHPAVVAVLDYGIDEGLPFLVMELMEGDTLRQRMAGEPMPRVEALSIAAEVADALIAAHEIRLIHRDIKPENTFLQHTSSGARVRVMDFGLAFLATGEASLGRMTQEGFVGGTPAYMSPEQVHGRGVGPAADIYSLGCMLYELVAGHPPFRGSLAELLTAQAYAPPRPLRLLELPSPVPPELDRLVMSMLSKSAPLRPTPLAVWQALRDLVVDAPSRASSASYVSDRAARALPRPSNAPRAAGSVNEGVPAAAGEGGIARGSGHALADTRLQSEPGNGSETQLSGAIEAQPLRVLVLGELEDELELGLIAAGCQVERDDQGDVPGDDPGNEPGDRASSGPIDVVWAPGVDDAQLAKLAARAPVVTDLGLPRSPSPAQEPAPGPLEFPALLRRLRAGATDLVIGELTPDQLARKLLRAARRSKQASRRT